MLFERLDRPSDSPVAIDQTGSLPSVVPVRRSRWAHRIPSSWLGMWGYAVAGVFLGLILIATLTIARNTAAASSVPPGTITDSVTRLDARELDPACFDGMDRSDPARLMVSLEVGLDGKVRYVSAAGATPRLRACVESHVTSWEFLPQAQPQAMVLPFEVAQR